jgi:hypothetical protein
MSIETVVFFKQVIMAIEMQEACFSITSVSIYNMQCQPRWPEQEQKLLCPMNEDSL